MNNIKKLISWLNNYISHRDLAKRMVLAGGCTDQGCPVPAPTPILDDTQKQMLVEDLVEFISMGVDKYIDGAVEHGGTVLDVDTIKATKEEAFDLWIYTNATKRKLTKV